MRHFSHLDDASRDALFAVPPQPVERDADPAVLALALGATLYTPATRTALADDARRAAAVGATSQVWDLEDSVPRAAEQYAQSSVVRGLRALDPAGAAGGDADGAAPLLFVRVRRPEQVLQIVRSAGRAARRLSGFVLPKFAPDATGTAFLTAVQQAGELCGARLYALPVLEHPDLAWRETRADHLEAVRAVLDASPAPVLSVRVGGTDLCGLFGLRRDAGTPIWDLAVVRDALADVLNTFARRGDYVVSGPVWEHFGAEPPRGGRRGAAGGGTARLDGLSREIALDRANGFCGKTVIHPSHVAPVNARHVVSRDELDDALTVLAGGDGGGVVRSPSGTRMNELGPHALWAEQVAARAGVYGVLADPGGVGALVEAGARVVRAVYGTGAGADLPAPSGPAVTAPR